MRQRNTAVPILGRAPVVGPLFRSRDQGTRRTELVVFLKPTLLRDRSDGVIGVRQDEWLD